MGFIERLRQEKEAEALAAQQLADERSAAKQAEETARQQEKELHRHRRQQAEKFREGSGVGSLVQKVKEIVSGHGYEIDIKGILNLDDPDSAYDYVVWGSTVIRSGKEEPYVYSPEKDTGRRIPTWGKPYVYSPEKDTGRRTLVDYDGKFIIVESQPSGDIVFHGNENTEVSVQDWKDNKSVLESALEKSYGNPGFMYYSKYIDYDAPEGFKTSNGFNARFTLDSLVQEKRGQESPVGGSTGAPTASEQSEKNDPIAPRELYPSIEELLGLVPGPGNPGGPGDPRGPDPRGPDPRGPDPRGQR